MKKRNEDYECHDENCGTSKWSASSAEEFEKAIKAGGKATAEKIKKIVCTLATYVAPGACLWYGVSPDTKRQNVLVWIPDSGKTVLCLDTAGKSRIYCKGATAWHKIHSRLLQILEQEKLRDWKPGGKKTSFHIDVAQKSEAYINRLYDLYTQAIRMEVR